MNPAMGVTLAETLLILPMHASDLPRVNVEFTLKLWANTRRLCKLDGAMQIGSESSEITHLSYCNKPCDNAAHVSSH